MARLKLFEVRGADVDFRPSPFCWRSRMALKHKGLEFEPVPWRAVEKDRIARSGGKTVPVLVDGEHWIGESWSIATHLEDSYGGPPLFADEATKQRAKQFDHWVTTTIHPLLAQAMIVDQFPLLAPEDRAFYLQRTLDKFGQSLEKYGGHPERAIHEIRDALRPIEQRLDAQAFLGGDAHDYRDYVLFGVLQCGRVTTPRPLVAEDTSLARWFDCLLDAFDGFGRAQPARSRWT